MGNLKTQSSKMATETAAAQQDRSKFELDLEESNRMLAQSESKLQAQQAISQQLKEHISMLKEELRMQTSHLEESNSLFAEANSKLQAQQAISRQLEQQIKTLEESCQTQLAALATSDALAQTLKSKLDTE